MDRLTHRVHQDLLAQVAGSAEEEAHVRRVLSAPLKLREDDLDAQERYKRAPFAIGATNYAHRHSRHLYAPLRRADELPRACSRCESGLAHCVTPTACERAESEAPKASWLARLLPSKPWPITDRADPDPPRESGDTLRVVALLLAPMVVVGIVAAIAMGKPLLAAAVAFVGSWFAA